MSQINCPGQDRAFWNADDIYNVTCGHCGASVEFFKTDGFRTCPKCEARIVNPRMEMGCAQWCQHATACLGYDPKDPRNADPGASCSDAKPLVKTLKNPSDSRSSSPDKKV